MRSAILGGLACVIAAMPAAGWAQDLKATQRLTDTQITFDPGGTYSNYTLTITGPNGFHMTASSKSDAPTIDLRQSGGAFDDGTYHYNLTAATDEKVPMRTALDNGRSGGPDSGVRGVTPVKGVATSGVFYVRGGAIVKTDPAAREQTNRRQ